MSLITRPMKPAECLNTATLYYPVLVTPKLDGIRCLKIDGKALSNRFKPIPNKFIREWIEACMPEGVDGEITLRGNHPFHEVSSAVSSENGEPDFIYCVFDLVSTKLSESYIMRINKLKVKIARMKKLSLELGIDFKVMVVFPSVVRSEIDLLSYERDRLDAGFEGIIIRDPVGPYKCGRATEKEGYFFKLKRFKDSEAEILGTIEEKANNNQATTNELGLTKRSTHAANKKGKGTLGSLAVRDIHTGVTFNVSGFSDTLALELWSKRDELLGRIIKYKYQPAGVRDKPRFPKFLGFRELWDIDT